VLTVLVLAAVALAAPSPHPQPGTGAAAGPAALPAPARGGGPEGADLAEELEEEEDEVERAAGAGGPDADDEAPPPGTPEDQALWRSTYEVSVRVHRRRLEANELQWELRRTRPDERLAALAAAASRDEAARLEALRQRYVQAWSQHYLFLVARWPVDPTRVCLYPKLSLESAMRVAEGPERALQVAQARVEARQCVETAASAVGRLEASTSELRALLDEISRAAARPAHDEDEDEDED
jgi:hypothetical protein